MADKSIFKCDTDVNEAENLCKLHYHVEGQTDVFETAGTHIVLVVVAHEHPEEEDRNISRQLEERQVSKSV
jgi:hypothetical protein